MTKALDRTGQIYGRWTVIERVLPNTNRGIMWLCECSCGIRKAVASEDLVSRHSTSCGCYRREFGATIGAIAKHGQVNTRTYKSWRAMKYRCLSPTSHNYKKYGGRGITIYPEWIDSFEAFFRDNGERPSGMTLDRINNDGNYEPGNTRWATPLQQTHNRGRNS